MKTLTTTVFALIAISLALPVSSVFAASPGFGNLYFNGTIVRTVVVPSAFPNEGRDNFYKVTNGVSGQLGIAGEAPGSGDYHGGAWKVFTVPSRKVPHRCFLPLKVRSWLLRVLEWSQ